MKQTWLITTILLLTSGNLFAIDPTPVEEQNLDIDGNIAVHEQGEVSVWEQNVDREGYIRVHEQGVADVNVTNEIRAELTGGEVDVNVVSLPDGENPNNKYQFVGFSTGATWGHAGVFRYSSICREDFGKKARWCTSVEVLETEGYSPFGPDNRGWVRPVLVGDDGSDASGTRHETGTSEYLSCNGWGFEGPVYILYKGLAIDQAGRFELESCSVSMNIACCSNVPQRWSGID